MDGAQTGSLLKKLTATVEAGWEDVDDDRRLFICGLRQLQQGDVDAAWRHFRRAARYCEEPFDTMALMARARCEVVRGHQAAALTIFGQITESDVPSGLRRMAWMEIADLARERGDRALLAEAGAALRRARM